MATITGLTAERMIEMENATIISGFVVGNDLILLTKDGTPINAGNVRGLQGIPGASFIICTSTTRPAFGLPDAGKAIYETDTKLIRIWIGTRWRLQEKIICTSVTRPPGMDPLDEGVKIYETDTNLEFTWTGTSWLLSNSYVATFATSAARSSAWVGPPDGALSYLADSPGVIWAYYASAWHSIGALGRVGSVSVIASAANGSGNSPADVPGMTVSWTAILGRRYKISVHGHQYSSVLNDIGFWSVCDAANASKHISNTITKSTDFAEMFDFSYEETGLSGATTRKLRFYPPVAGGICQFFADATRKASVIVEDIGV